MQKKKNSVVKWAWNTFLPLMLHFWGFLMRNKISEKFCRQDACITSTPWPQVIDHGVFSRSLYLYLLHLLMLYTVHFGKDSHGEKACHSFPESWLPKCDPATLIWKEEKEDAGLAWKMQARGRVSKRGNGWWSEALCLLCKAPPRSFLPMTSSLVTPSQSHFYFLLSPLIGW